MQFRFRKYSEEVDEYTLVTIIDVKDYDTMYKTLIYMRDNNHVNQIELLDGSIFKSGEIFCVKDVCLCIDKYFGEDALVPYFGVDVI